LFKLHGMERLSDLDVPPVPISTGETSLGALAHNQLIETLPPIERRRLLTIAEKIDLVRGEILDEHSHRCASMYFPAHGFISLMATLGGKPVAQVCMIGREGMWGPDLTCCAGNDPMHALVLAPGFAWRINARALEQAISHSGALRRCMDRYFHSLIAQLASSAACLGFHRIEPRLARWLLMSQDRAQSNSFFATQEVLSAMLGVRRVGVTAAAGELQRRGLIEYSRGYITILNRAGLEVASCSCYPKICAAHCVRRALIAPRAERSAR
jgi:CRP-like cAMP-binding protein